MTNPGQAGGLGVQVTLLREVAGQAGRGEIGLARGGGPAGHLEQVRADRGQPVIPGQPLVRFEPAEPAEPGLRAVHHGDRDGVVQRHDRVALDLQQELVQGQDLRPVGRLGGRRLVVHGGDRRLQLVRAGRAAAEHAADQRHAFFDAGGVPAWLPAGPTGLPCPRGAAWPVRRGAGR